MAFRPPTLKNYEDYDLCSSRDPALDLPAVPELPADAPAEEVAKRDEIVKSRNQRYQNACDTGRWHEIEKPGQKASRFTCRNIHGPDVKWLRGEVERNKRIQDETAELAFRLGVVGTDIPAIKLSFEEVDGNRMLTKQAMREVYSIGRDDNDAELGPRIVEEIGGQILLRALQVVRPLS